VGTSELVASLDFIP